MSQSLALTRGQQLMLIGQQLHPESPLYNQSTVFIIEGVLDIDHFWQAFDAVVTANGILRLTIDTTGDHPQQIIHDVIDYPRETVDLSGEQKPRVALDEWVEHRTAQIYDLSERLFDSVLLKLADNQFAWYFGQHHIVTDGGSTPLLYQQLSEAYQTAGNDITLDASPSYETYVNYAQEIVDSDKFQKARAYWDEQLTRESEPFALFSDNKQMTTRAVRHRVSIGTERMALINELIQDAPFRSFSPNMTYANLFTALTGAFLHVITGYDALRIGTPMLNRPTKKFRRTPGLFMEVVSMFLTFDADETLATLVQKVAAESFAALQHTQPGISTAAHNRAYNVMINYVTTQYDDFAGLPVEAIWLHAGHGDSNHQFRLQIHDMNQNGAFELLFEFNTGAFDETQRRLIIERYLLFMDMCLSHPSQPFHHINLLTDDEQAHYQQFNTTQTDFPADKTFIELFEAQVQTTPDAIALALDSDTMTYAALSEQVNAFAARLLEADVKHGQVVALCMERSFEMLIALLAAVKIGAIYVPLEPTDPIRRHQEMLADSDNLAGVITDKPERFAGYTTWTVDSSATTDKTIEISATPDDIAYVLYTSGSTGKPKGVRVSHRNLTNYLTWANHYYDGSLTFALYSSVAVDMTVTSLFTPLIGGGTVKIYPDAGARGTLIRDVFTDNAVDVVKLTPSHLNLVQDMDLSSTRIRQLIVGGEMFQTALAQTIDSASNGTITQYNEYGPTEATVACTVHAYDPQTDHQVAVPIGKPIANTQIHLLDRRLQPVMTGIRGELYIGGEGIAAGYHNRPDITHERFIDHPEYGRLYKSGDVARRSVSGELDFLGRADRQVKIRGVRIELDELESLMASYSEVHESVVMVRDGQTDAERKLVVFYSGSDISQDDVRAYLAARLPVTMLPDMFVHLETIPLRSNGKVDMDALKGYDLSLMTSGSYIAPRNHLEEDLTVLWQEMLGLERIGIRDNFFNIGGHSLPAIRIVTRIKSDYDVEIPMTTFFNNPTVEALAETIETIMMQEIDSLSDEEVLRLLADE